MTSTRQAPTRRLISQLGSRPAQAPETLVHFAVEMLLEDTRREAAALLAARPGATPAELSREVAAAAVHRATVEGAIAGTPLYVVLVPAYIAVLLEQARMVLTIAALHGAATDRVDATADLLVLTMVHPDTAQARREVEVGLAGPDPVPHHGRRAWLDVGRALLILANVITPSELDTSRGRHKTVALAAVGTLAFVLTFVFSIFSVLAVASASQSITDTLGRRAREYYGDEDVTSSVPPWYRRALLGLLVISAVVPVVLLVIGIKHHHPHGLRLTHLLIFFVALALVIAALWRLLPTRRRGVVRWGRDRLDG